MVLERHTYACAIVTTLVRVVTSRVITSWATIDLIFEVGSTLELTDAAVCEGLFG